ncbi:MAG: transglycosylase domain-containing protein [Oscillospiraceae bacterium]|jgi:penicillin-binding protein 1A
MNQSIPNKATPTGAPPGRRPARPPKKKLPLGLRATRGLFVAIGRVLITLILVGIITGCIVGCVLTVYILQYIGSDNSVDLEAVKMGYTSLMLAEDPKTGEEVILKRLYYGGQDRTWVDYDNISEYTKKSIVAIEDKRFWTHDGVDWRRTVGAFIGMFLPVEGTTTGGGSTITQQLIKNVTGDNDYRVERKVREIFRALDLHKNYSREEILEAYLNLVPLGNGTNGIQAAANFYFGKDAKDLTLEESAAIVGITKYPGLYNPYRNPEEHKKRQVHVLSEMLSQGMITQEEYDKAVDAKLNFVDRDSHETSSSQTSSYFVDHVINEVVADLMEYKGMEKSYALNQIYSGGYRIYTTVDLDMQAYLEEFFRTSENFPAVIGEEYPESATAIIDPSGKLLAVVGGIGEKTGERTFNRATMSRRHPGSALKPIGPYALAFERNNLTWSTIVEDSPLTDAPDGWSPVNYYSGFLGPITVDRAIQQSVNTVAAKVVQMLTPRRVFNFLRDDLHFTGLVEREVQGNIVLTDVAISPMALGALTYGVSPLEMAGAYQIFINGGQYTKPYSYTRIEDFEGNIILEKDTTPTQVIAKDTAVLLNKLLQQVVVGPHGTARNARLDNMPTGGKTGTSQDNTNQWFVGFSPYYVAPAWLGYDRTTKVVVDANGRRQVVPNAVRYYTFPPPVLWKSMMQPLHTDLEYKDFIESPNVVSMTYCTESGGIATAYCPTTASGWYKTSRIPSNCTLHTSAPIEAGERSDFDIDNDDYVSPWLRRRSGGGTAIDSNRSIFDEID